MRIRTMMLAATLAAALALPAMVAAASDCDGIDARIAAAKTSADHEAIAACFDAMAKAAHAKSAEHEKMGAEYRKEGTGMVAKLGLTQHCVRLANGFAQEAKTYEEMAAAHREMAKAAK